MGCKYVQLTFPMPISKLLAHRKTLSFVDVNLGWSMWVKEPLFIGHYMEGKQLVAISGTTYDRACAT
jgi:hypothetical protein